MNHFRPSGANAHPSQIKWLLPGMHVKRWILLLMAGIVVISLGVGYFLREAYSSFQFPAEAYYVTLQFLPRTVRGMLFVGGGVLMIVVALWRLSSLLMSVLMPAGREERLVDMIYQNRFLQRGPKVVAIGGGTGLSTLLRGIKQHTGNLTAIVTVADDGGSSGTLRRELGVLPPGDIRQCIAALADSEPLMSKLLQYRFQEGSGLEGHSFGNLFIVAMSGVVGSFEDAVTESCRVLAVRGQIFPSTLEHVTLLARFEDESLVHGESAIPGAGKRIERIYLQPEGVPACPAAVRALEEADLIVLGPGSLYTSVLPNLLVAGISGAIRRSRAMKVYVCNVATQHGETGGFSVADHVDAIFQHVGPGLFHHVMVNTNLSRRLPAGSLDQTIAAEGLVPRGVRVVRADVVDDEDLFHHDPSKLSDALLKLYYARATEPAEAEIPVVAGNGHRPSATLVSRSAIGSVSESRRPDEITSVKE